MAMRWMSYMVGITKDGGKIQEAIDSTISSASNMPILAGAWLDLQIVSLLLNLGMFICLNVQIYAIIGNYTAILSTVIVFAIMFLAYNELQTVKNQK